MRLLDRYIPRDFSSLEDFYKNYELHVPQRFNFAMDVMDEYARLAPSQRAMIWVGNDGSERTFSFADIKLLSDKAARVFLNAGVGKGDRVLLLLKRRWQYWIAALGLMKIGAVQIPATAQLMAKDIVYRLDAAEVKMTVCVGEDEVLGHVAEAVKNSRTCRIAACTDGAHDGFADFDRLLEEAEPYAPETYPNENGDIMLMYFTSGTTGMPKMVAHDFVYPLGHTITGAYWHNLDDSSIHLTTADSGWAKCGWGKFYGQWTAGATQFIYDFDRFHAADLLEVMAKYKVTSFCAPPTIYRYLIKEDMAAYDLSALKWATAAGEPLNPEVFRQFREATGVSIREGFGQTESVPLLLTPKWMEARPGSVGKPSPHVKIRLVNEEGRETLPGEEGEICVDISQGRPAGIFMGYYKDEARTDEVFAGGLYHTGDKAWRDEDGYFWFIGRSDDVIKSSGYRIGPFEVESALVGHPAVVECAVTGVPDPDRGQIVKATVILAKGYEPSPELAKELQRHVKKVTAPYKYPRIVEFVSELPKTVSGKIQRKMLREADAGKDVARVELREITMENFAACAALTAPDAQAGLAPEVSYCIAQAFADRVSVPRAVYAGSSLIGFVMYRYDSVEKCGVISRLMIDTRYQRNGFGREVMQAAVLELRAQPGIERVRTWYRGENNVAGRLCERAGFAPTGELTPAGERICEMRV
ncbi:MAG: GNAT family N-acetyltransferase [Clostridia bacterium]|nr:GNAT family N-acetyltransferase [Clostridia bacterium]